MKLRLNEKSVQLATDSINNTTKKGVQCVGAHSCCMHAIKTILIGFVFSSSTTYLVPALALIPSNANVVQ